MSHKSEASLYQLCRAAGLLFIGALCAFPPGPPAAVVSGQTDCTAYNQCAALQGASFSKLTGNIVYSFDMESLNLLPSDAARQNFMSVMQGAAAHWAQRTGRSITQASAGQSGNVTIRINNSPEVRDRSGVVSVDDADSSRALSKSRTSSTGSAGSGRTDSAGMSGGT